jgi:hypothetical protein
MRAFVATGLKDLPKTPKLVLARDEGHARSLMAEQSDKRDERWLSHDHASMDAAPAEAAGVLDAPVSRAAKEAVKA